MHVGITHIDDAKWADVFVIAPASADVIARIAAGMANDHLTATLLAATCPVVLAPAMNTRMYDNPVTQRNMTTCRQLGMSFVEPSSGLLACEDVGKGGWPSCPTSSGPLTRRSRACRHRVSMRTSPGPVGPGRPVPRPRGPHLMSNRLVRRRLMRVRLTLGRSMPR